MHLCLNARHTLECIWVHKQSVLLFAVSRIDAQSLLQAQGLLISYVQPTGSCNTCSTSVPVAAMNNEPACAAALSCATGLPKID